MNIRKHIKLFENDEVLKKMFENVKKIQNQKPQVDFDKKFNTTIAQHYSFPHDLDADTVYSVLVPYMIKGENEYLANEIIENLNYTHFPYPNIDKLSKRQKIDVLLGMSSCFNKEDIIWFAIDGNTGVDEKGNYRSINLDVKKLFFNEFGEKFYNHEIEWIPSFTTFEKIKEQLNKNDIYI